MSNRLNLHFVVFQLILRYLPHNRQAPKEQVSVSKHFGDININKLVFCNDVMVAADALVAKTRSSSTSGSSKGRSIHSNVLSYFVTCLNW